MINAEFRGALGHSFDSYLVISRIEMKVLILVFFLYFCSTNALENEDLQKWVQKCRVATGFDKKDYTKLEDLMKDPESKNLFLCVARTGNMLDNAGFLKREAVKAVLPQKVKELPIVDKLLDDCVVKKNSAADTVFHAFICIEKRLYFMRNGKVLDI